MTGPQVVQPLNLVLTGPQVVQHDAPAPDPVAAAPHDLQWAHGAAPDDDDAPAPDPVVPAAQAPLPLRHLGVLIGHHARHVGFAGRGSFAHHARCVRGDAGF